MLREHRTHGLDTPAKPGPSIRAGKLVVLVIGDEPDHRLPGRSSSAPKKIAAAYKISLVIYGREEAVHDVDDTRSEMPGNVLWTGYLRCL